MKQLNPINDECQHESPEWLCARDATWGTFRVSPEGVVELGMPARIWCGQHKPALDYRKSEAHQGLRNVRLRRA